MSACSGMSKLGDGKPPAIKATATHAGASSLRKPVIRPCSVSRCTRQPAHVDSNMNVAAGYGGSRSSQTELTRRLDGVGSMPEQADAWRFEGQGLCCCRLSALTTCLILPMQVLRRPARSDAIYHACFLFVLAGVFRKDTASIFVFHHAPSMASIMIHINWVRTDPVRIFLVCLSHLCRQE